MPWVTGAPTPLDTAASAVWHTLVVGRTVGRWDAGSTLAVMAVNRDLLVAAAIGH